VKAREPRGETNKPPLRRSLGLVVLSGMLAMVYVTGIGCPAHTEFFRAIGAHELHFGLLTGIPMFTVLLQFAGAFAANHLRRRKRWFMCLLIVGRLLYLPVALIPLLFPSLRSTAVIGWLIALVALSGGLINLAMPLWFSWMADLIPHRVLNRYWGVRHQAMYLTWTMTFVAITVFTALADLPILVMFPVIAVTAVAAGVVDILLFAWVREPGNTLSPGRPVFEVFLEPLRHETYKGFVRFSCAWSASVMLAAAFMQLYVLKVLAVPVWQAMLMWCMSGAGSAVSAKWWGRGADRHGHRPVLLICILLKSMIVVVFALVTRADVLYVLPPALFIDGVLNGGMLVASNGFMMKIAPKRNRSMFIASITGLSGIAGGVAAILGGLFLRSIGDSPLDVLGQARNNYQVLFLLSAVLRIGCILLVKSVREPASSRVIHVFNDMIGVPSLRFLRFPVGFYRR